MDIVGYIVIILFGGACIYGIIRQMQETLNIAKSRKSSRRGLVVNVICTIAYIGFIASFLVNILSATGALEVSEAINKSASISCWISVLALLVGKYYIVPKS